MEHDKEYSQGPIAMQPWEADLGLKLRPQKLPNGPIALPRGEKGGGDNEHRRSSCRSTTLSKAFQDHLLRPQVPQVEIFVARSQQVESLDQ